MTVIDRQALILYKFSGYGGPLLKLAAHGRFKLV